jgi:hydrogenase maturation protease
VVEVIGRRWSNRVTILSEQHPLPEWAPVLARAELALLVDASQDPTVDDVRLTQLDASAAGSASSVAHALGAREVLALTLALYGRVPETLLVEIPADECDFGEGFSEHTRRAIERAVAEIENHLQRLTNGSDGRQ